MQKGTHWQILLQINLNLLSRKNNSLIMNLVTGWPLFVSSCIIITQTANFKLCFSLCSHRKLDPNINLYWLIHTDNHSNVFFLKKGLMPYSFLLICSSLFADFWHDPSPKQNNNIIVLSHKTWFSFTHLTITPVAEAAFSRMLQCVFQISSDYNAKIFI